MRRCSRRGFTVLEFLVVLAIVALLASLGAVAAFKALRTTEENGDRVYWHSLRAQGVTGPRSTPLRVLFIGNSYTMGNQLPGLVGELARLGPSTFELEIDTHLVGGATLEQHYEDGQAVRKIREGKWDVVVLQEQSTRPLTDPAAMHHYARLLCEEIRAHGAIPMFFLTWARQHLPETQARISRAYYKIAYELRAEVAPVGAAWQLSLQQDPSRTLHLADRSHPNPTGSYLAALVFHAALHDRSPEGLPASVTAGGQTVSVPAAEARTLQAIAWQAMHLAKEELRPTPR